MSPTKARSMRCDDALARAADAWRRRRRRRSDSMSRRPTWRRPGHRARPRRGRPACAVRDSLNPIARVLSPSVTVAEPQRGAPRPGSRPTAPSTTAEPTTTKVRPAAAAAARERSRAGHPSAPVREAPSEPQRSRRPASTAQPAAPTVMSPPVQPTVPATAGWMAGTRAAVAAGSASRSAHRKRHGGRHRGTVDERFTEVDQFVICTDHGHERGRPVVGQRGARHCDVREPTGASRRHRSRGRPQETASPSGCARCSPSRRRHRARTGACGGDGVHRDRD